MTSSLDFRTWTAALSARGWTVLSPSHAVPVQLWLRSGDTVLHLLAQGTRVVLRRYAGSDLTALILRSACDCEEHRTAGCERPHRARTGQRCRSTRWSWTGG